MRYALFGLLLAASIALGADTRESTQVEPEAKTVEPAEAFEDEADAEIREIEKSVSGAGDVEEFVPDKPLSADKAISLPSDI